MRKHIAVVGAGAVGGYLGGRRTEIGELNGLIVQKAKDAGCPAPTHERIVDISCVASSAARSRHGRSCCSMHDTGLDRKQQRI